MPVNHNGQTVTVVTKAIVLAFGGVKATPAAEIVDADGQPIPGLFAAGEMVGGIFYYNYPGGSSLRSGVVFGKITGTSAGKFATR